MGAEWPLPEPRKAQSYSRFILSLQWANGSHTRLVVGWAKGLQTNQICQSTTRPGKLFHPFCFTYLVADRTPLAGRDSLQ